MIKEQIKLDKNIEKCKKKFIRLEGNKLGNTTTRKHLYKLGKQKFRVDICQVNDLYFDNNKDEQAIRPFQ